MPKGFVYILVSASSNYIKIGGTERPISERLRAINASASYSDHGPWNLSDFLHVTDWQLVEGRLHRHFKKQQIQDVTGTRELFSVPPHEARRQLRLTDVTLRFDHQRTEQIFKNEDVRLYLHKLFQLSGLYGNLDIQGAWTLSLMTSTRGGRWFTLNIGSHEVAFATRKQLDGKFSHYLVLDRLVLDYPETVIWIGRHDGDVLESEYVTSERAVTINFQEDFSNAEKVLKLPGVRRALIAYWSEGLADLRERNAKSTFARYHSYDAVAELLEYKRATDNVFDAARDLR